MNTQTRFIIRFSMLGGVLATMLFLQGCTASGQKELDESLSKAVVMKYVHVANVSIINRAEVNGVGRQLSSSNNGFWAVFNICSLDVQGSALKGFNFDANKFVIETEFAEYGIASGDSLIAGGASLKSNDPAVLSAVHTALGKGASQQFFPKQFFPTLGNRIAIYVRENPRGYRGEAMTLKYNGLPQAAVILQKAAGDNPEVIQIYFPGSSPPFVRSCP